MFRDRADAGRQLAEALQAYTGIADGLVVALPRGGVTVGALVAVNALGDVLDERGAVLAGSRALTLPPVHFTSPFLGSSRCSFQSCSFSCSSISIPRFMIAIHGAAPHT